MFHVKHTEKGENRGEMVSRETSAPGAFGNANGEQNGVLGVLPVTVGVHPRALHHAQPLRNGVEKEPDILEDKDRLAPGGGRRGGQEGINVFLRAGYGQGVLHHIVGGGALLLSGGQPEKGAGMPLGVMLLPQQGQHIGRKAEEPQLVGHCGLGLSNFLSGLLLGEVEGAIFAVVQQDEKVQPCRLAAP